MAHVSAKEEYIKFVMNKPKVKCVEITHGRDYRDDEYTRHFKLKVGYSDRDFVQFLSDIDFKYDCGFGGQELYGTIWFEDDTWADRWEYDGSEGWEYQCLPPIPLDLLK